MNNKNILLPRPCKKVGWCLLILAVLAEIAKTLFVHDMDAAWYLAKAVHIVLILSLFLICMSKEKVEDEMISGFRLKSVGITAYTAFVLLLFLSIILEVKPGFIFKDSENVASAYYLGGFFLIILPVLLFALYYGIFKCMIWKSK